MRSPSAIRERLARRSVAVILLSLTLIGATGEAQQRRKAQPKLSFGEVKVKVVSGPDADGDVWFAVKVEAHNRGTKDAEADIRVRGLDAEGFEMVDLKLTGKVKAGQKRELTESMFTSQQSYQSIVKWEVED